MRKTPFASFIMGLMIAAPLSGCFSTATNRLPQTVPAGEVRHIVSSDLTRFESDECFLGLDCEIDDPQQVTDPGWIPLVYSLRVGLKEGLELGATLNSWATPGLDVKVRVFENKQLALSIDPGVQVTPAFLDHLPTAIFVDLPVLLGVRVSPTVQWLISARGGYTNAGSGNRSNGTPFVHSGMVAGLGTGVHVRLLPHLGFVATIDAVQEIATGGLFCPSLSVGLIVGEQGG